MKISNYVIILNMNTVKDYVTTSVFSQNEAKKKRKQQ